MMTITTWLVEDGHRVYLMASSLLVNLSVSSVKPALVDVVNNMESD